VTASRRFAVGLPSGGRRTGADDAAEARALQLAFLATCRVTAFSFRAGRCLRPQNPKTHQWRSLSHGRDIGSAHATFASQEGQICKPKMSQFDAIRGDACAGMFSRMGKMRRPRVTRSISRYRVAEAGKVAVSKCKLRIFKMRRISFGRTGQSSRGWLGKNWRKAAATSSSPRLDGL
jgi:hypothetical protein